MCMYMNNYRIYQNINNYHTTCTKHTASLHHSLPGTSLSLLPSRWQATIPWHAFNSECCSPNKNAWHHFVSLAVCTACEDNLDPGSCQSRKKLAIAAFWKRTGPCSQMHILSPLKYLTTPSYLRSAKWALWPLWFVAGSLYGASSEACGLSFARHQRCAEFFEAVQAQPSY